MKQEIESLKSVNRRILATLARLEGKMGDMAERMVTKDDLQSFESRMNKRFDAMAGKPPTA